jgi:hypothetical protein
MKTLTRLLFDLWIAPAFGLFVFGAGSITVLGTTQLGNGLVRKRAVALGDNAYPVAGYDFSPAAILAALGLKSYKINDAQTGFEDPVVTGVNQQGLLAEFVGLKLLVSLPTGGATACPTTLAAPLSTTGTSTASAVNATTPAITPGPGKACVVNTDFSGATVKFFFDAVGYPA